MNEWAHCFSEFYREKGAIALPLENYSLEESGHMCSRKIYEYSQQHWKTTAVKG